MNTAYEQYAQHLQKLTDIEAALAVMAWDKEVNLPEEGARFRSQQVATLSGILHEESTSEPFVELVKKLREQKGLDEPQRRNLELTWRDLEKVLKLDTEFVKRRSRLVSAGYHAWLKARKANDFAIFAEPLEKLVALKREEAERLGYDGHPYNALVDQYEPNATVAMLDRVFEEVKEKLTPFAAKIRERFQPEHDFLHKKYPRDEQWAFGLDLLRKIGYRFEAGRQDLSPHPFTITFSPQDVRVTTRVDEHDLANMTWSCIHEGGHALYEQGLPVEGYGQPIARAASLSIHESQSRLWENHVGRSLAFWKAEYPGLQRRFPEQLSSVSLDRFYRAINRVAPNLIRTEADELHYHFHVLIRYEIEKELVKGKLEVNDIPKVWKEQYKKYLGVEIANDNQGALQDIHWAHGSLGYFPTYSLGSFYAAQFYAQAEKEIPELEEKITGGHYGPLLDWLREHIHRRGRQYDAEALCEKVTGEPLRFDHFMQYAEAKFGPLAG